MTTTFSTNHKPARMKLRDSAKILFLGDSLTHGVFGESYIEILDNMIKKRFPDLEYRLINKGRSGDTVYSLLRRVERDVISLNPHIVFILIGANDVLLKNAENLEILQERSGLKDQIPAEDIGEFKSHYRKLINHIKRFLKTRLVLCSTGIIGEDLKNRYNRQLVHINIAIRKMALDYRLDFIDINAAFYRELQGFKPYEDYIPRMPDIYEDLEKLKSKSADKLSQERGLKVTYDGGHLNSRGADIIATQLYEYLTN
ncbi:MAG: hypothetical protein GF315_04115 [candidate division Zixibacteria bacterium]|nr:hypothetical protein [candidate division Zixibacteria bacterium]